MRARATSFGLLLFVLLLAPASARAVSIAIEPADTSVTVGDTLTLRVVATAFPDLKGYQLIHAYDASRLSALAVHAGDVLTGAGGSYVAFPLPDAVAPQDSTWLDAAMLDGSTSGPGVLEYIVFATTAKGDALVTCEHAELRDSQNAWTYPGCAGGVVHILGPVPVRRPTWGGLKTRYR